VHDYYKAQLRMLAESNRKRHAWHKSPENRHTVVLERRLRCSGNIHTIRLMGDGSLVMVNHVDGRFEALAAMAGEEDRCHKFLDGWMSTGHYPLSDVKMDLAWRAKRREWRLGGNEYHSHVKQFSSYDHNLVTYYPSSPLSTQLGRRDNPERLCHLGLKVAQLAQRRLEATTPLCKVRQVTVSRRRLRSPQIYDRVHQANLSIGVSLPRVWRILGSHTVDYNGVPSMVIGLSALKSGEYINSYFSAFDADEVRAIVVVQSSNYMSSEEVCLPPDTQKTLVEVVKEEV
jgi:hypothetical protein